MFIQGHGDHAPYETLVERLTREKTLSLLLLLQNIDLRERIKKLDELVALAIRSSHPETEVVIELFLLSIDEVYWSPHLIKHGAGHFLTKNKVEAYSSIQEICESEKIRKLLNVAVLLSNSSGLRKKVFKSIATSLFLLTPTKTASMILEIVEQIRSNVINRVSFEASLREEEKLCNNRSYLLALLLELKKGVVAEEDEGLEAVIMKGLLQGIVRLSSRAELNQLIDFFAQQKVESV